MAYICSRYYRAPELIFANTDYDSSIDVWSLGCVLAEAFYGKPIFQGDSTVDQLFQIFRVLGTPDNEQLQILNKNGTMACNFPSVTALTINKVFQGKGKDLTSLLNKIFNYEPHKRLTALEIMAHPFFDELRQKDCGTGKYIIPQLFDFTEQELQMHSGNKNLLKKIIPEWSDCYKQI